MTPRKIKDEKQMSFEFEQDAVPQDDSVTKKAAPKVSKKKRQNQAIDR